MPDDAHDAILDRGIFARQIADSFSPQIKLMEQLVNYGTSLLPRSFDSSNKGIPDTVAILSFLKHAVTSLDGISILVAQGATLSCFPLLRSIFEIELYLRWIFESDYENRATAYYVWNLRKKRYWLRCYLQGTPEFTANADHMKNAPPNTQSFPYTQADLKKALIKENSRLKAPELAHVNSLFEQRMKSSGKDVEWYYPFGVNSIRDMAIQLGDEAEFKVFYSQYSQATHGLSIDHQLHLDAENSQVVFDHIRTLKDVDHVFQMSFTYSLRVFRLILKKFRYGELDNFSKKYKDEWRVPSLSIPKVEKDGSSFTISPPSPIPKL